MRSFDTKCACFTPDRSVLKFEGLYFIPFVEFFSISIEVFCNFCDDWHTLMDRLFHTRFFEPGTNKPVYYHQRSRYLNVSFSLVILGMIS